MIDYREVIDPQLPPASRFPACFAFSVHKAGSSMMFGMLSEATARESIPAISVPDILFKHGIEDQVWQADETLLRYFSPGRLYYGFRYFPSIFNNRADLFGKSFSVLLLRDPRDALVSQYYSFKGSHALPNKNQEKYKKQFMKTASQEINQYVISSAPIYREKLNQYVENTNFARTRVFRYEDVVFNKGEFLEQIFQHFRLDVGEDTIKDVSERHDKRPEQEDEGSHIRKVTPGDHVAKLRPETIRFLNNYFSETCNKLGIQLE